MFKANTWKITPISPFESLFNLSHMENITFKLDEYNFQKVNQTVDFMYLLQCIIKISTTDSSQPQELELIEN